MAPLWLAMACAPALAYAAPGDLDAGFGTGGTIVADVQGAAASANDLAIDPQHRIVAAGTAGGDFALVRWTGDGMPDPDFGGAGIVRTHFGPTLEGRAVVRRGDGRLFVAGDDDLGDYWLARYEDDGSSPTAVNTHLGGVARAFDLLLDPNDALVLAGFAPNGADQVALGLLRFGSGGMLDTDFGLGGFAPTTLAGVGAGTAVVRQSSGAYVVVTPRDLHGTAVFALTRVTHDGAVDGGFGADGVATAFTGDQALALAQQSDGKLVAVGSGLGDGGRMVFAVARFTADGVLDRGFGTHGIATATFATDARATAVAIEADGRVVVAGATLAMGRPAAFALARFAPWGALDTTFGSGGTVTTAVGDAAGVHAMALQDDGRAVVVGAAQVAGHSQFVAARYALGGPVLTPPPPTGDSCTTVAACRAALGTALPAPESATTRKARRVARRLARRFVAIGRAIDASTVHTGARQATLRRRAHRLVAAMTGVAARASAHGALGVPLAPLSSAITALSALLAG